MKIIAVYVGRFQPFHRGHHKVYQDLVDRFGEDSVFIGTSDKTDPDRSPLNFSQKRDIMTGMFDIPSNNIVKVKNPYRPEEILKKYDPNSTAFVTALGEKDADRLSRRYFEPYDERKEGMDIAPYKEKGYYVIIPNYKVGDRVLSGTQIRDVLGNPNVDIKKQIEFFKDMYGKFDQRMFRTMRDIMQQRNPTMVHKKEEDDKIPVNKQKKSKKIGAKRKFDPGALTQKVRNPVTRRDILVRTALNYPKDHPVYKVARKLFAKGPTNEIFESVLVENALINQYNELVDKFVMNEKERESCRIYPTDTPEQMAQKSIKAYKKGAFYYPLAFALSSYNSDTGEETPAVATPDDAQSAATSSPVSGVMPGRAVRSDYERYDNAAGDAQLSAQKEAMTSTERVRKFFKRHPERMKQYSRKTAKKRAARNRDRRKAIEKYGKEKMKNHDVHHPNGPTNGNWKLAPKDHGKHYGQNEEVVTEGGAPGHLMHPYEDRNLTFSDYKEIIHRSVSGALGKEEPVTEKLDGQNIAFTVKDGQIRFARNKGHVKNGGENSMTVRDVVKKFEGYPPGVKKAFVGAAKDLNDAIKHLDDADKEELFANGKNFMSTEIILPDSQNVIPYDKSVLVFHGNMQYDDDGNLIGTNREDAKVLNDKIVKMGQEKQERFGIQGPNIIAFNDVDIEEQKKKMNSFNAEVDRLKNEFELEDESKVSEYYGKWWKREIEKEARSSGIELSDQDMGALIDRWAFGNKEGFKINDIQDQKVKQFVKEYESNNLEKARKTVQNPFEMLFLKVGAFSLQRVANFLTANNPGSLDKIMQELEKAMNSIDSGTTSAEKAEKLMREIERLEKIGLDKAVPSEGLVFIYNGQPYKFTGTFAPMNQIIGSLKYDKPRSAAEKEREPKEPSGDEAPSPGERDDDGVLKKKALIKQFYQDRIENPLTGREITIQSALTYDRSHPARQQAVKYLVSRVGGGTQ